MDEPLANRVRSGRKQPQRATARVACQPPTFPQSSPRVPSIRAGFAVREDFSSRFAADRGYIHLRTGRRTGDGRRRSDERDDGWRWRRLSRARAQISPEELRRSRRPGADGSDTHQRVRDGPHRAGLYADRRARRRQDDDGPHSGAGPQLQDRHDRPPDHRHAGARRPLRRDHGRPPCRRDRDGRRLQQRHRQYPRDHRGGALQARVRALQGLYPRRGAHALGGGLQRVAQDARRAAGACEVHLRDHGDPQGSRHRAVALPAIRSASHRSRPADRPAQVDHRSRKTSRSRTRRSP